MWATEAYSHRVPLGNGTIHMHAHTHTHTHTHTHIYGFPGGSEVKASACNAGDLGSIPGLGRFPGEGNGNPFQYSCLENPMDGGAWWATVHGVAESDMTERFHSLTHSYIYIYILSDSFVKRCSVGINSVLLACHFSQLG